MPLERGFGRSSGEAGLRHRVLAFQITFSHSLLPHTFPKTPLLSFSLYILAFSLGIDLVRVVSSPWAFTKKLLIVEGYLLIQEIFDLEHFRFLHLLRWVSTFEVGIPTHSYGL